MLAVDEHEKIRLGRLIGGKRIAAVQQFLRLDACQPIHAQPVDGLKADDSLLRIRAERAVRRVVQVAQIDERLLELFHVLAGEILFERARRRFCGFRGIGWGGCRRGRDAHGVGGGRFGNQVCAAIAILRAEGRVNRRSRGDGGFGSRRGIDFRRGVCGVIRQRVKVRFLQKRGHQRADQHDGQQNAAGRDQPAERLRRSVCFSHVFFLSAGGQKIQPPASICALAHARSFSVAASSVSREETIYSPPAMHSAIASLIHWP